MTLMYSLLNILQNNHVNLTSTPRTGTSVGDTATLECESCKKSKGEKHSVCTAGGVWEPPLGRCQNVVCKTKVGLLSRSALSIFTS